MATQGMITVVKDGKVVAKLIVGCNGYNAHKVAAEVASNGRYDFQSMAVCAGQAKFGCDDCYVYANDVWEHGSGLGLELKERVRRTFHLRSFNPRWERGSCEHVWVVDLDKGSARRIASYRRRQAA